MKRRRLLLTGCALLIGLIVSACSTSGGTAAFTVNGQAVSRSSFDDQLKALLNNADFVSALQQQQQAVAGKSVGTIDANFARKVMAFEIDLRVAGEEVANRKLTVDPTVKTIGEQAAVQSFGGTAVWAKYPQSFRDLQIAGVSNYLQLELSFAGHNSLDDALLKSVYNKDPTMFDQRCVSHILVATSAAADQVVAQLKAGADFATLAKTASTDTGSAAQGGQLRDQTTGGCQTKAQIDAAYVAEFAKAADAAKEGVPTDPVHSQFGYHVILVTKINTFDQVKDQVKSSILAAGGKALSSWRTSAYPKLKISVDPRYGIWDPKTLTVVAAPAGKADVALS